jgi:hypothetical protein
MLRRGTRLIFQARVTYPGRAGLVFRAVMEDGCAGYGPGGT